jgi:signal peptidase I
MSSLRGSIDGAEGMDTSSQTGARYRRSERRWLFLAMAIGLPLFLVLVLCLPGLGPVFRVFTIPSGAMMPMLPVGSYVVVSRASYGYSRYSFELFQLPLAGRWPALMPRRGDVVVFLLPRDRKTHYVKRVVGLPGDRIQMVKGRLSINEQLVPIEAAGRMTNPTDRTKEDATYIETLPDGTAYRIIQRDGGSGPHDNTPVYTVPAGHLFVLGDNRSNSTDSREHSPRYGVGFVPVELVIGRVVSVF